MPKRIEHKVVLADPIDIVRAGSEASFLDRVANEGGSCWTLRSVVVKRNHKGTADLITYYFTRGAK